MFLWKGQSPLQLSLRVKSRALRAGLTPTQWCVSSIPWSRSVYSSILLFCIAGIYPRLTFNYVSQDNLLSQSLKCWITGVFHQGQPGHRRAGHMILLYCRGLGHEKGRSLLSLCSLPTPWSFPSQVTRGWTTRGPWRLQVWKEQCLLGPPFGTSLLRSLPALSRSYAIVWSESYGTLAILKASSFHFFLNDSSWFKGIHWTWFPSWNLLPKPLLEIFQLRNKSLHIWWWLSSWSKKGLLHRSCDTQKWTVHLCCRPRLWILPRVAFFLPPNITGVATGANSVHSGNDTMKVI